MALRNDEIWTPDLHGSSRKCVCFKDQRDFNNMSETSGPDFCLRHQKRPDFNPNIYFNREKNSFLQLQSCFCTFIFIGKELEICPKEQNKTIIGEITTY